MSRHYFVGSLLSGGSSDPKEGNSLEAWTNLYDRFQAHTQKTRLRIPILYGVDAVHGHNNVLGAVIFPHNIGLGCTRNPKLVEQVQRVTAEEVRATGIQWAFAPCVTVRRMSAGAAPTKAFPRIPNWCATSARRPCAACRARSWPIRWACWRAPSTTSAMAAQRSDRRKAAKVSIRATRGRRSHPAAHPPAGLYPRCEAGVGTIMPSYSSWNGVKCSASKRLLTDILKEELGFEGFLISDYNAIDQITLGLQESHRHLDQRRHGHGDGADALQRILHRSQGLGEEGKVPMSRIDDAVTRILRVKFAMGMMDATHLSWPTASCRRPSARAEHRQWRGRRCASRWCC